MNHDLHGFWPVRPGSPSYLYHSCYYNLRLVSSNEYVAQQVAICLFTKGFSPMNWAVLMAWDPRTNFEPFMDHYRDHRGVQDAARANSLSVTRDDGLDWLRTVLRRKPGYYGPVPVWTRRALRELRSELGVRNEDLARLFGVKHARKMGDWVGDVR
jgi:hypothetical protein